MQCSLEQTFAIKFCVKLGKTTAETVTLIKTANKEHALSDQQVFWWHKAFLEGQEEVDGEDCDVRPSITTTADHVTQVRQLLNSDQRLSVRLMADMLNISKALFGSPQKTNAVFNTFGRTSQTTGSCTTIMRRPTVTSSSQIPRLKQGCNDPPAPVEPGLGSLQLFSVFPRLKTPLKDKNCRSVDGIKPACTTALQAIVEDYRNALESWKSHCSQCIDTKGDCFADF